MVERLVINRPRVLFLGFCLNGIISDTEILKTSRGFIDKKEFALISEELKQNGFVKKVEGVEDLSYEITSKGRLFYSLVISLNMGKRFKKEVITSRDILFLNSCGRGSAVSIICKKSNGQIPVGSVYSTGDRLEKNGFVTSRRIKRKCFGSCYLRFFTRTKRGSQILEFWKEINK